MLFKRKIIYIVNPISGTSSKDSVQNIIAAETLRYGAWFRFFPSVANGNYDFLKQIIAEEKITDVVIVGGDGTVSQVVDSLMHQPVKFGIVPAGSGNGLAFGAGIPKSPQKALEVIFHNKSHRVDGFRINGRFACMLCGIGFDAKVAHDFAESNTRGLATYVKQVFYNFFTAKPYNFKIKLKETVFEIEAYFISIANSNQFGNNFTIAPRASLSDGLLDVVIVTHQSKLTFVYNTLKQVNGLNRLQSEASLDKNQSIIYFQTDDIRINNRNDAPMHIDGEPVATEKKIHASVEKKCFKLLLAN